jgi:hypothetical protein
MKAHMGISFFYLSFDKVCLFHLFFDKLEMMKP